MVKHFWRSRRDIWGKGWSPPLRCQHWASRWSCPTSHCSLTQIQKENQMKKHQVKRVKQNAARLWTFLLNINPLRWQTADWLRWKWSSHGSQNVNTRISRHNNPGSITVENLRRHASTMTIKTASNPLLHLAVRIQQITVTLWHTLRPTAAHQFHQNKRFTLIFAIWGFSSIQNWLCCKK